MGLGVLNRSQDPPPVVPESSRQAPIPAILIGFFPFIRNFLDFREFPYFFLNNFMYWPEISRKCIRNRENFKVSMENFFDIPPQRFGVRMIKLYCRVPPLGFGVLIKMKFLPPYS